ncbi:MAG TPA: GxxExxY protein [Ignavibacteria bacterium]|nr:GxxExxY protein [Ignavibacteria bacterium]
MNTREFMHETLTERIIGCCFTVYNKLGFGYLESVYEKSLMIELRKADIYAETQKAIKVKYDDVIVGDFIADIIAEHEIVLELKSIRQLSKIHEMQLVNYLVSTGMDIGLLINFGEERVEVKRKQRILT